MIGSEDALHTYEYEEYYKILPSINNWSNDPLRINNGNKVGPNFTYTSDKNSEQLDVDTLKKWIKKNRNKIGSF